MNKLILTANAALAASLIAQATPPTMESVGNRPGIICTANASLFTQAHFSEPQTAYALGWQDGADLEAACEFLAPTMPPSGELYEHMEFENAEAFLSDGAYDDLRAIGADFKTVEYGSSKTRRKIRNRGLRIVVDSDEIKNNPNWQNYYTGLLVQRIQRNAFRRKVALAVAAGTAVSKTWGSSADPDQDIIDQAILSGDASGVQPNRALWGLAAQALRSASHGSQATAAAFAGRSSSVEEAAMKASMAARVEMARYQNATAKSQIVGSRIILFTGVDGASVTDPSNFKTARANTDAGGRYAVYVRQITTKQWEVVVECYEDEFTASTLGVRVITAS